MKYLYHIAFFSVSLWMIFHTSAMASENGTFLYVSLDSAQTIAIYKIDQTNGDLTFVKGIAVDGQPGSLTVDPTNRFIHAALRTKNSVASFRIDETNGDLKLISTVNVSWNPVYLSMDRSGKFLFTSHFSDNKAAVYAVGQNGAVQSGALQVLSTASNPHSIQIDKSNRYLFVPCRSGEAIFQYRFDDTNGSITANAIDRWITRDSTGPRHIIMHPFLSTAYVANEFGRSVTAYELDDVKGTLTEIHTLSMQPENPKGIIIASNTGGADVHSTPNGRFLYATNRGPDSIAAYSLNPSTGLMTSLAQYPTEKMPRSFSIDPSGKYLYVGGQRSGKIAAYKIDTVNGTLSFLKTYSVGSNPVWLQSVDVSNQKAQSVGENINSSMKSFMLSQNYPNPFNPSTTIEFSVPVDGLAKLKIYTVLGQEVATLFNGIANAGQREQVTCNASLLSTGVYVSRLEYSGNSIVKRMMVIK